MFTWRIVILLLLAAINSNAQTIEGRVSSIRHQPLSLVSVVLLKDGHFITAATTDEKGYFRLIARVEKQQTYTLHLSLVGYFSREISFVYPDTIATAELLLTEDPKMLADVSITGRPPGVIRKTDRYIINVENGPLANGLSATEVLQRSPGVWLDNMGSIRLRGTQPVTIMINDIVQRLGGEELADLLRSLKSEDISRVEIISNPPSEFEAGGSGGIIHIILKKGKKNGWNGSVNSHYGQQGRKPYFTTGATLNYQFRKLYLSGSYIYVKDLRSITEEASIHYPDLSAYDNFTDRDETIGRNQYRLTAAYDINAAQTISVQSVFSRTGFHQMFQSDEVYYSGQSSAGKAASVKRRVFDLTGITLNYSFKLDSSGGVLNMIADVSENGRAEKNEFYKIKGDSDQQRFRRNDVPIDTRIYSLQSDYTKALNSKTVIKSGIKYASIRRDNQLIMEDLVDTQWIKDPEQSDHFIYSENILMLYSSVERTLKHAVVKAGLRTEETFSAGNSIASSINFSRNYFGLFPSLSIMKPLNAGKGTAITASYSRRLTRPSLSDLNPARMEFNNYTALRGNPNLLPQYSHLFSLEYQLLKNHSAEIYFIRTNNYISLSANPGPNNSIDYYSENTGSATEYGLGYSSTVSPLKLWTITTNFSAYRSAYRFNDKPYRQTSFYASLLHTVVLEKIGEFDLMADYRSPYIYTNLYTYGNFNVDMGFTKKVLKAKGRIRLGFTDLLNTSREKEWTDEKGTIISFYRKRPTRTARLSFTYRFSSGRKMLNKSIDQGGIEEKERI